MIEWKKLNYDSANVNSRYGHTGVIYSNKLYIFGGKFKMNNHFFMGDVEVFNIDEKQWSTPICYTKSTLKLRSNHISELIGN